ncbi:hypothetical protein HMPREF3293_01772 [Christensenella minuta]|uniref:Uncharacterized protein n=1 Tax=Christensenella minuta TaxID=626937 RepID=A0A136Q4E2_9FIRM|nr:hypothetical protein HMPREF3293_01772 [Christensenella minuta]
MSIAYCWNFIGFIVFYLFLLSLTFNRPYVMVKKMPAGRPDFPDRRHFPDQLSIIIR